MATPDNIQRFNDTASKLFAMLYAQFPDPFNLGPEDFDITEDLDGTPTWKDKDFLTVNNVIQWLSEEGYVRMRELSFQGWDGVVLTQKGLTVLRSVPEAISGDGSIGDRMQDAVKTGSKSAAGKLVDQALSLGMQLAWKSATQNSWP